MTSIVTNEPNQVLSEPLHNDVELKLLMTNFFYKDNSLRIQILIQSESSTNIYGEFDDYVEYRNAYDIIQLEIIESQQIHYLETTKQYYAKVA
jgi:hypothetical protein